MRADRFTTRELDGRVERSARVRWEGGEETLSITVPAGFEAPADDASAFLAACLLPAMLRGEDLELDGAVSARLLAASPRIRAIYAAWRPGLAGGAVTAAGELTDATAGDGVGCFFSRGVDSAYSVSRERDPVLEPALTHAVFVDGIEPTQDAAGRREEVRRAAAMAGVAGLPLVVAETNIKHITDPLLTDWGDIVAGALSFAAHSLAGGFRHLVIAPTASLMMLAPEGSHPILDPLYSTERVVIEHDDLELTRAAKVRWLARRRPELLPHLKVCYAENRPDNCGRCMKCLFTMAALQAAGALELAKGFPDELDTEAIDALTLDPFSWRARYGANATAHALAPDGEQGRTRAALLRLLRRSDPQADAYEPPPTDMIAAFPRAMTSVGVDGRPYPPMLDVPGGSPPRSWGLGLVRSVDRRSGRHLYAIGSRPPGELAGEVGALVDGPGRGRVPVWLDEDARLHAPGYAPVAPRPAPHLVARWLVAPLTWLGVASPSARARAVVERLRLLAVGRLAAPAEEAAREHAPAGFLLADEAPGHLPLWSAVHPVTGDQLLSTSWHELNGMGYVGERLLGWLEARAPVTGELGSRRPLLPWASHLGRRGMDPLEAHAG